MQQLIEQKRSYKERDTLQKQEKQLYDLQRQAEAKEQQHKMSKLTNDVKAKNFTYDYEGNIILQNQLRPETLPPTSAFMGLLIKYLVDDQKKNALYIQPQQIESKDQRQIDKRKPQKLLSSVNNINQNAKKKQKEIIFLTPPTIFDSINPLYGVTYIENGKVKQGPKQKLQSLSLLTSMTPVGHHNSIRLSRDDYSNLTKQGNFNLSREVDQEETQSIIKQTQDQSKLISGDLSSFLENKTNQSYQNNLSLLNKSAHNNSFIKIQNMKNFTDLLQFQQEKEGNINQTDNILPKIVRPQEAQLNSFDQFNMSILRQKQSWGLNGQQNEKYTLPMMPQIKNQQSLFLVKKKLPVGDRLRKYKLTQNSLNKDYYLASKKNKKKSPYYLE